MNVTVEKFPKCLTDVSATFPAEDIQSQRASIISSFSNQAQIPGFRPGKVPKSVVEKRYAKEIEGELEYKCLNEVLSHAVQEEKIDFISVKERKLTHDTDGSAHALITLVVTPEFELPEYKGLEVSVPELEVTEEMIEAEILTYRQRQGEYPSKEEGGVEDGDIASISYSAEYEGKPAAESFESPIAPYDQSDEYWVKAGDDRFLPGFSNELLAMVKESEKTFDYTFADDFVVEELQGKTFSYTVTLKDIKEEKLPSMEELVKKLIGEDGEEEKFREMIKGHLTQQQEKSIYDQKAGSLMEQISGAVEIDLPEDILAAEIQSQADRLVGQGMNHGMSEEQVMKMEAEIVETAEKNATGSLVSHFILQKIAQVEEITVDEQEVMQKIFIEAYQRGEDPQQALKDAKKAGTDQNYHQSLLLDKTIDFLINEAKVTTEDAE